MANDLCMVNKPRLYELEMENTPTDLVPRGYLILLGQLWRSVNGCVVGLGFIKKSERRWYFPYENRPIEGFYDIS